MIKPKSMKFYGLKQLDKILQSYNISSDEIFSTKVVANVLPFRTNNYVVEELIDWNNIPNDPMYQLTFMQRGMLKDVYFNQMAELIKNDAPHHEIKKLANEIRLALNPHPAGQLTANVPFMEDDNEPVPGVQHKYNETCLVFPSAGQTCHAYCTFCFRWAQFVGMNDLKFATDESKRFQKYLTQHKEVTDVLFTGGDPMIMSYDTLKAYIEPLLSPEFEHIRNIRIGTKSISYWPYKYVTDKDSSDILHLFEEVVKAGKHLAIMAHFNHWVELTTKVSREAIRNIRNTGAEIRTQSPLIKHINDDPNVWATMWKEQVKLGIIPYYFFIERDTGAVEYFAVPIARAFQIFRDAFTQVSGLSRTVRGPSMSANPGKVAVEGITEINGEKVFVLNFLQARNSDWVKRPFFAKFDAEATWLDRLEPAFGQEKFFFQDEFDTMLSEKDEHFEKLASFGAA